MSKTDQDNEKKTKTTKKRRSKRSKKSRSQQESNGEDGNSQPSSKAEQAEDASAASSSSGSAGQSATQTSDRKKSVFGAGLDDGVTRTEGNQEEQESEKPRKKSARRRRSHRRGGRKKKQADQEEEKTEAGEADTDSQSKSERSSGKTDASADDDDSRSGSEKKEAADTSDESASADNKKEEETKPKRTRRGTRKRSKRGKKTKSEGEDSPAQKSEDERIMLINVADGEECRIAIVHENRLEELFFERASSESHVGNIYKGRVTNVEPSIQAAFVDFGLPKNGFLHISDLQPQYFPDGKGHTEEVGRKTPRRERPPIQRCLRRGQEVIVQIIKEGIGTKGPTLTTYISIPGRYLVMMPGMNKLGVSRRIEDEDARRKMRKVLDELGLPKNVGFILRTAGLDKTKRELQRDQTYLQRLWKRVAQRIKSERAPCELYQESDLVIRTIRDVYSSDFSRIVVDDEETADKVRDFLAIAMPRSNAPVDVYAGPEPLFHKYGIEREIEQLNARYVPLRSGGSLVIDSTEAMVTIDVNSGRFRDHEDAEETAYRIDLEAAEEIARQLRLRDLGGLILCDFIDMISPRHRRAVEKALRDELKKHKERAKCLRMSQFGIIEMTRQRTKPSIKRSTYQDCPHCRGTGLVKNPESMTLDLMRLLRLAAHHDQVDRIELRVSPQVAFLMQNRKRQAVWKLEQDTDRQITVRADSNLGLDQYLFTCFDRRGGEIRVIDPPVPHGLPDAKRAKQRNRHEDNNRFDHEHDDTVFD